VFGSEELPTRVSGEASHDITVGVRIRAGRDETAKPRFLDHHNVCRGCLKKGNKQRIPAPHVYRHDRYGCINHSDDAGATIGGAGDSPSESIMMLGEGARCNAAVALTPFFSSSEESPVRTMGDRNLEWRGQERDRAEWPLAGFRARQQLIQTMGHVQ